MIHIYTGSGKGKTTAAVGAAVRMAGYGRKVLFAQFLKGARTGETELLQSAPDITVLRCDKKYGFFGSMTDDDKENIKASHNKNLSYIIERMQEFDMIVLDEIFDALNYNLADYKTVRQIAENFGGELLMTGRNPDKYFEDAADYITEMKKIKHPYDNGVLAREGIEY